MISSWSIEMLEVSIIVWWCFYDIKQLLLRVNWSFLEISLICNDSNYRLEKGLCMVFSISLKKKHFLSQKDEYLADFFLIQQKWMIQKIGYKWTITQFNERIVHLFNYRMQENWYLIDFASEFFEFLGGFIIISVSNKGRRG